MYGCMNQITLNVIGNALHSYFFSVDAFKKNFTRVWFIKSIKLSQPYFPHICQFTFQNNYRSVLLSFDWYRLIQIDKGMVGKVNDVNKTITQTLLILAKKEQNNIYDAGDYTGKQVYILFDLPLWRHFWNDLFAYFN